MNMKYSVVLLLVLPFICEGSPSENEFETNRVRRAMLVGGYSSSDTNDPKTMELAKFALLEVDKQSNSLYSQAVVEITDVKTQVVAGTNTAIEFRAAETDCLKNRPNKNDCGIKDTSRHFTCRVKVWDQPWTKTRELTSFSCTPYGVSSVARNKRDISNSKNASTNAGYTEINKDDPTVLDLANFALRHIDYQDNSAYWRTVVRVMSCRQKVAAQTITKIEFEAAETACRKNKPQSLDCGVKDNARHMFCQVRVVEDPATKKKLLTSFACSALEPEENEVVRNKRSALSTEEEKLDLDLERFKDYVKEHKKIYKTEEEFRKRFRIFRANLMKIKFYQENEQGTAKYGPNLFADLSATEFKERYLGLKPNLRVQNAKPLKKAEIPNNIIPTEFDWRDHDVVTPVKNQGMCGSCWAFAVTGNIEGQWAIKTGKLVSLSEQELVDCDTLDSGCQGGLPSNAYEAIEQMGGLETETDYPYDGKGESCKFNKTVVKVDITGAVNISTNEDEIARWLVENGPIAIGINANAMQFYMGGVSHPWKALCSPNSLDHGVLIVGYGIHSYPLFHKSLPFWIVKNSWGPKWGEQGYYRVFRGDGTCGVNQMASSATIN